MSAPALKDKTPTVSPVRLEEVSAIVRAAVWTGKLADEKPVSLCLIANQESAKSKVLMSFEGTPTLDYLSDLTSKGIEALKTKIENHELRHICLTDLIRIVCHGRNVTDRTIQMLSGFMEEGQSKTADAGGTVAWKNASLGVLTSITPQYFKSKRGHWRNTGFLTRMLPVHYDYSDDTINNIHARIREGKKFQFHEPQNLPMLPVAVKMEDPQLKKLIESEAMRWREQNKDSAFYGFRYHIAIRALAKAEALRNKRKFVGMKDLDVVLGWSKFFNIDKPIVI